MNNATKIFIEKLQEKEIVEGIILFGSWARGNNRPGSDVDLLVIVSGGYSREIETYENQIFEIIYTTKEGALEYWESDIDGCASLWEVGQIIYDKTGEIEKLKSNANKILDTGKPKISEKARARLLFVAKDQLESSKIIAEENPSESNALMANHVFELTKIFFDLRQRCTPAPKQRFNAMKEIDVDLYENLIKFYAPETSLEDKFELSEVIIKLVFKD